MDCTTEKPVFAQLHAMKQRMDRLFAESFKVENAGSGTPERADQSRPWEPFADVWESGDSWLMAMDLPGVAYEDLQVELAENRLIVKGTRKPLPGYEKMTPGQIERSQGAFSRTFMLPGNIQEETIKAELRQGELTVLIAKGPGSQVTQKRIQVRAG